METKSYIICLFVLLAEQILRKSNSCSPGIKKVNASNKNSFLIILKMSLNFKNAIISY